MNCNKAQSLILDHLYGDLKPRTERALLRHLQQCPKCAEELETHKATASTFARLSMEEPPPGLSAKIAAMAAEDIERQKANRAALSFWSWKPALATVATATLVVVIVIKYIPDTAMRQSVTSVPAAPAAKMLAKQPALESYDERKEIAAVVTTGAEGEVSAEYRGTDDGFDASGRYGGELDMLGDAIVLNGVMKSGPELRARSMSGGKAALEAPRDTAALMSAPEPSSERESRQLSYKRAQSMIRLDSKDYSEVAHADEETATGLAWDHTAPASPETPAAAKPRSLASEMVAQEKEKTLAVGGAGYLGERKSDLDDAQEESARANAYFNRRELNEAVKSREMSISSKPEEQRTPVAMYILGETYRDADRYEEAVTVYELIPKKYPDFGNMADVYIALGECYIEMGKLEDALRCFEIVRDKFPKNSELALEKIDSITELQKASEKASEAQADTPE